MRTNQRGKERLEMPVKCNLLKAAHQVDGFDSFIFITVPAFGAISENQTKCNDQIEKSIYKVPAVRGLYLYIYIYIPAGINKGCVLGALVYDSYSLVVYAANNEHSFFHWCCCQHSPSGQELSYWRIEIPRYIPTKMYTVTTVDRLYNTCKLMYCWLYIIRYIYRLEK